MKQFVPSRQIAESIRRQKAFTQFSLQSWVGFFLAGLFQTNIEALAFLAPSQSETFRRGGVSLCSGVCYLYSVWGRGMVRELRKSAQPKTAEPPCTHYLGTELTDNNTIRGAQWAKLSIRLRSLQLFAKARTADWNCAEFSHDPSKKNIEYGAIPSTQQSTWFLPHARIDG
ncbi:hypothetical protein TGAM01_v201693 [Trichoderma gamsii]|uniref:Uncharacterized protein n=1 Tax=Trichoderma gamsii TaxID=398673 RepID=A0A2P4ZYQ9_9HYPO|nr:hypothetical protein TGAM01_v201693 [Trichoderma gamsii]PON29444.1 hypothetical protein TGAM01_v201693 [Trichoderma gamsii]